MWDFVIALMVTSFAVATAMEMFKSGVNAIGKAIVKKRIGIGAEVDFSVPSFVWWIAGTVLTAIGVIFARKAMVGSNEEITPLLSILLSPWLVWAWGCLVWWVQMQLDMQVIKKYAVPIIKKALAKKLEVDDDD
ncbi:MAG: hypothetical protein WCR81_10380 [Fermentimonas sp.]